MSLLAVQGVSLSFGGVKALSDVTITVNGELTPALALRRAIVRNRYAHRLVAA